MLNSDEHLERALAEYNEKVSALEDNGPEEELLDALVNRGCVLYMMDSFVAAYGDFDDASEIIARLEDSGKSVDPGLYVKTHMMEGLTLIDKSVHEAVGEMRLAASRLPQLSPGARHFPDARSIADSCLDCAAALEDADMCADALPFIDKAMSQLVGKDDAWSRNRYMEACGLEGEALEDAGDKEKAMENYSEEVRVGEDLRSKNELEDPLQLADAYLGCAGLREGEEYIPYAQRAAEIMEELNSRHALDDPQLLSGLYGDIARAYMSLHRMKEAEQYLMKQVKMSIGVDRPGDGSSY
jgi:tetratricopeptide (TPR) repeat protein